MPNSISNIWNKLIKFKYKLIANFTPYRSSLVSMKIFFAVCVSYAVSPVKINTPIIQIANINALLAIKMFTILAIIIPINPINKKLPHEVKSLLVVYPNKLAPANVALVIKNTCVILIAVYTAKMVLKLTPISVTNA